MNNRVINIETEVEFTLLNFIVKDGEVKAMVSSLGGKIHEMDYKKLKIIK